MRTRSRIVYARASTARSPRLRATLTPATPARSLRGSRGGSQRMERALEELRAAILYVMGRPSSTIRICNLPDSGPAMASVQGLADAEGVKLVLERGTDGRGFDVVVRAS